MVRSNVLLHGRWGELHQHYGADQGARPDVFFRVDDLDAGTAKASGLGGRIVSLGDEHDGGDEQEAARFGRFVFFHDDQGSGLDCTSHRASPPPKTTTKEIR